MIVGEQRAKTNFAVNDRRHGGPEGLLSLSARRHMVIDERIRASAPQGGVEALPGIVRLRFADLKLQFVSERG